MVADFDNPRPILSAVRTDADIANDLRAEIAPHLVEVCKILDKARSAGLKIDFQLVQDAFGRHVPPPVLITKAL
jgi:hypothetical protein